MIDWIKNKLKNFLGNPIMQVRVQLLELKENDIILLLLSDYIVEHQKLILKDELTIALRQKGYNNTVIILDPNMDVSVLRKEGKDGDNNTASKEN